jgi:hypothetical protein
VEIDGAVAETAFLHQLKVEPEAIVGEGALPTSDKDRHQEELVLIDQAGRDRPGRELRTAHR